MAAVAGQQVITLMQNSYSVKENNLHKLATGIICMCLELRYILFALSQHASLEKLLQTALNWQQTKYYIPIKRSKAYFKIK